MAVVYLARDLKHDREVALKVLYPHFAAALGADRFLREVRVAARLHHPHLLPLYDSGVADGSLYYVVPYIEGGSLRDRLERESPLPLTAALQIAREVADGLDYAHRQNVVHRDIKPENILLDEGHAVIADFGVARAISEAADTQLTEAGLLVGTPAYMSPEQAMGGAVDGRSDIYNLGCVLFELLTGAPPFTGHAPIAILAQRLNNADVVLMRPELRWIKQITLRQMVERSHPLPFAFRNIHRQITSWEIWQNLYLVWRDAIRPIEMENVFLAYLRISQEQRRIPRPITKAIFPLLPHTIG